MHIVWTQKRLNSWGPSLVSFRWRIQIYKKINRLSCKFLEILLVFPKILYKADFEIAAQKSFASEKMPLCLGCRTPKTADLYLISSKSYSKNSHTHGFLDGL